MTLPKLKLAGKIDNPAWAPVPSSGIFRVEFAASLRMEIEPVALPGVEGANDAVRVTLCDGFIVAGVLTPVAENPVPLADTPEIFTAALPVLVR